MRTRLPPLALSHWMYFKMTSLSVHRFRSLMLRAIAGGVKRSSPTERSVTLIVEGGIGDFVLALPAIRQVQQRYRVVNLAVERLVADYASLLVTNLTIIDTTNLDILQKILERTDVVVLSVSLRTARFLWRKKFNILVWPVPHQKLRKHKTLQFLELFSPPLNNNNGEKEPVVISGPAFLNTYRPILVLKVGSTDLRSWSVANWVQVIRHFCTRFDIYLVGSAAEWAPSESIREKAACHAVYNTCGKTSAAELLNILGVASVVVSTDSGVAHLASALNRPTVVLFGPVDPAIWRPSGIHTQILYRSRWCSPCQQRYCPYAPGSRCMDDISADDTIIAIEHQLTQLFEMR